ncbi:MAG: histidine kinase [Burkholderiaceae bacterium]|nr:histidine kinase [Burkholderiaceae bacterium]
MYSILPALVSLVFLAYGLYVFLSLKEHRAANAFFLVCVTTFFWQFTWAVLFQLSAPADALIAAKFGYLLILFLPTTLYHFVADLSVAPAEQRWVRLSYALATILAVFLLGSDWLVAGLHHYFFGFYPKAGLLHPVHLLQTTVVVCRAMHLLYRRQRVAVSTEKARLRYCLLSVLIYFFAAVDYLCNYGVEFYPPGVTFIAVSLGLIAQAIVRHNLLANPLLTAATIAHEMRTPLLTIRGQARALRHSLPDLIAGYEHALVHGFQGALDPGRLRFLSDLGPGIENEVKRSNFIVDLMLASASIESIEQHTFAPHSIKSCIDEALTRYPFEPAMRARVRLREQEDFLFHGSDVLLVYVLHNLFKNAMHAIGASAHGEVAIGFYQSAKHNHLLVTDTGHGIPQHVLPHVFDPFYTTRSASGGTGMGLAFCQRVLNAFGGAIRCESQEGRHTTFLLEFPKVHEPAALPCIA